MVRLAVPVVVVQVGIVGMGVVDTIMVGHLSARALAATALGTLYFFSVAIFGMGTLLALDPVIAQAVGARDDQAIARGLQRGLLLSVAISVLVSVLLLPAGAVLTAFRQPAEVIPEAAGFARASIPGVLPFFVFVVFRQTLQALGRLSPIVVTITVANVLNAALNWVLIYGNLGSPPLGAVGSAYASSASRWVMAALVVALGWRELRPHVTRVRREALLPRPLVRMLRLGVPIGIQHVIEFGAFAVVALLMGWLGTTTMAAHEVAINLASLTFMVPFGVAGAAAVLVGRAVGRGDEPGARRAAAAGLACGVGFMALSAALFLLAPEWLARLYSRDAGVIAVAGSLIPIAGVFQVFDGLQAVSSGILRGVGDTRVPMMVQVFGFWLIGMPVSLWLAFRMGSGPTGLWWGLVAGLAAVGTFLLLRVRFRLSRALRRVVIDDRDEWRGARDEG
jgi:multidrug resistance protein, MATE family